MARRGRSIGTVGDAYVPVPFKELFQSNLQRQRAFDAAEDDITDIESMLGTAGGTAGDQEYIRDLGTAFTSEFQQALENTGGNLIETSSFLRNQLGKITQAGSIIDSNREAKQKFYEEVDKSDLDPAVADYLKMQSDLQFDSMGGSRARASYTGMPFVDLNAKEVRDQLLALGAKVPEEVNIEGVYDLYNAGGKNIYDIQNRIDSIANGTDPEYAPEEVQEYINSLPQGWDVPDPNINGGLPIFSMEKTKRKNKFKIANALGALAVQDPRMMQYFQQGAMANNALYPDQPTDAQKGFETMLMGVSELLDIPEQLVTKSFPKVGPTSDGSDDGDPPKAPSSFKTNTPPITQYPLFDNLTTNSSADMKNEIMSMNISDADKFFYNSLIDVARKGTDEGEEINFTNQLRNAANALEVEGKGNNNYNSLFEEYFLKEDGSVNMERIDFPWYANPYAWIDDAIKGKTSSFSESNDLTYDLRRLQNRLASTNNVLLDARETAQGSFKDNIENMRNRIDQQVELITVDDTKAAKENTLALNILTSPDLNEGGVFREEAGKFEKRENIGAISNALISGFEKYPVKINGEEYRGVQIKAKGTGPNAPFLTYRVRIPEAQFQSSLVNSGIMKDFNPDYKEYTGIDKDQIRNIAQAPDGAIVMLPQMEAIFNEQLDMYLNEQGLDLLNREFEAYIERVPGAEPYKIRFAARMQRGTEGGNTSSFETLGDGTYATEQAAGYAINGLIDAIIEDYGLHLKEEYKEQK